MNEERFLKQNGFLKTADFYYEQNIHSAVFRHDDVTVILDYDICNTDTGVCFDYSKYCELQNSLMKDSRLLFRFAITDTDDISRSIQNWLDETPDSIEISDSGGSFDKAHPDNTPLEKSFEDLFIDMYGSENLNCLQKEYSISMDHSRNAFVDYVIETDHGSFAIEENGVHYHHPQLIGWKRYLKQLEKQNMLSLLGFRTYRFSFENLRFRDQAADRIKAYLGSPESFHHFGYFNGTREFRLYDHQVNILSKINEDRRKGIHTSLVVSPTGSGKSQIAIEDIRALKESGKIHTVLVMVPTKAIREDWQKRLQPLMDEMDITIDLYNRSYLRRSELPQDYFDYILFDEAQHAQAANCARTLQYFTPDYLLGLTATPERLDQKKLEDIFGTFRTQLTLREAIEKDVVSNIRCYRLLSNIDLSMVRYNGKDYNGADLERTLVVESRNILIVETLKKYFFPRENFFKQGILFCVNVTHARKLEKLMREAGFKADAVYGANRHNEESFEKYRNKEIQFLITCQLISEGWDSPQTEIVVMARPTLSKVLYTQQIGRGVRKYPGKECLYVIDVVDNYEGKLTPVCFNSLMRIPVYTDFIGVKNNSSDYLEILGLHEEELAMQEIDILTFEEKYRDYLSPEQAARELFVGTATLLNWYRRNPSISSLTLPIGSRMVPYFSSSDLQRIRESRNLGVHDETTILKDFEDFIQENTLTFSFKLVFMLGMLKLADEEGDVRIDDLMHEYRNFYMNRIDRGLPVDRPNCVYTREYLEDRVKLKTSILSNPFEKFERKRFVYYSKDLSMISFNPSLWKQMTEEKKETIRQAETAFLKQYYEKYGGL